MEHNELVKYLENALRDAGYNDLAKVDIFKSAVLIRDPITKEMTIPFKTRPSKTDTSETWHGKKFTRMLLSTKMI